MRRWFVEPRDRVENGEAGACRALRVIVVGRRVAEESHHPISDVPGDVAIEAGYRPLRRALIARHCRAPLFGVDLCRQCGGTDQIAEQDREMPPLTGYL